MHARRHMAMAAAILSLTLAGCASQGGSWYQKGATQQQFYKDRGECTAMGGNASPQVSYLAPVGFNNTYNIVNASNARAARVQSEQIFSDCMRGRGWVIRYQ